MAITFGLLAALFWGLTDFLISVSGRSFGVLRSMLLAQGTGVVLVGGWLLVAGSVPDVATITWLLAVVAAAFGLLATLSLYRSLKAGSVAIGAPIAASFGAVTTLLSIAEGDVPSGSVLLGLCLVLIGVLLAGVRPGETAANKSGLGLACLAAFGFGVQFWLQGRFVIPQIGSAWSVWTTYLFSTAVLSTFARLSDAEIRLDLKAVTTAFGTGTIAVGGFVFISAGLATGQLALVTVLSSMQSVVTLCLAILYYGEKPVARQWIGLVVLVTGVVLTRIQ